MLPRDLVGWLVFSLFLLLLIFKNRALAFTGQWLNDCIGCFHHLPDFLGAYLRLTVSHGNLQRGANGLVPELLHLDASSSSLCECKESDKSIVVSSAFIPFDVAEVFLRVANSVVDRSDLDKTSQPNLFGFLLKYIVFARLVLVLNFQQNWFRKHRVSEVEFHWRVLTSDGLSANDIIDHVKERHTDDWFVNVEHLRQFYIFHFHWNTQLFLQDFGLQRLEDYANVTAYLKIAEGLEFDDEFLLRCLEEARTGLEVVVGSGCLAPDSRVLVLQLA